MPKSLLAVKSPGILEALFKHEYDPNLVAIALEVCNFLLSRDITPVITSAFRSGDPGVHGYGRGIDFRTHQMEAGQIEGLVKYINHRWTYDPSRPGKKVAMFHDVGRGPHLHFQTHPHTVRRMVT